MQTLGVQCRLSAILCFVLLLGGCTIPPSGAERVELKSADYGFIDEILDGDHPLNGKKRSIRAWFFAPSGNTAPPWPAVVMLHSSIGIGTQDWEYTERFRDHGLAVLAVDSFGARGVERTVQDQLAVSQASMMADAYAALDYLSADPRIEHRRIGVVGFSKGGIAALYAAFRPLRKRLAHDDERFAAHLAYYPWCGLRLLDSHTTGAPILIQAGELDNIAPPALCDELMGEVRSADPRAPFQLIVHEHARHAFDHPLLALFGALPVSGVAPANCRFREVSPGVLVESESGEIATARSLKDILTHCANGGGLAGGNDEAADSAWTQSLAFLTHTLLETQ